MPDPRIFRILAWAAAVALGAAVFAAGLSGYWVFDDFHNIVLNQALSEHSWDRPHLMALLMSSDSGVLHRPLSTLSFYLDSYWFGLSPWAFKLTNILIHLAAGLSFAGMASSLLQLYRLRYAPAWEPSRISAAVLITTSLWLVHPINLTAVLYVVQRETSLAAVFTALAVWAYLWGRRRQFEGKTAGWILWLLTPALTLVGVACKENATLVPAFLFVIELTVLDFRLKDGRFSRQVLAFFALFLALPALAVVAILLFDPHALLWGYAIRGFSLGERLLTECRVLFSYLRWIAWPDLRQLGLYHDDIALSRDLLHPATTLPAVAGILLLLVAALALRRRLPLLCFGILWFFAGHLLESSVLPLELAFEHRNYVPLYGLILGVVGTLAAIDIPHDTRRILALMATLVCLMFAGLTALRASEWRSPLAFAIYEAGHHPGSSRAQYEVGAIYASLVFQGEDRVADAAEAALLKARALDGDSIAEDLLLAMMHATLKQPDLVHTYLQDAIQRTRTGVPDAQTQASLQSAIAFSSDKVQFPITDMEALFQAVLDNPHTQANPCYSGNILNTYALFLEDNGEIPRAMSDMHKALVICPSLVFTRINYVNDLIAYHDIPDAKAQIKLLEQADTLGQYTLYIDRLKGAIAALEHAR